MNRIPAIAVVAGLTRLNALPVIGAYYGENEFGARFACGLSAVTLSGFKGIDTDENNTDGPVINNKAAAACGSDEYIKGFRNGWDEITQPHKSDIGDDLYETGYADGVDAALLAKSVFGVMPHYYQALI